VKGTESGVDFAQGEERVVEGRDVAGGVVGDFVVVVVVVVAVVAVV